MDHEKVYPHYLFGYFHLSLRLPGLGNLTGAQTAPPAQSPTAPATEIPVPTEIPSATETSQANSPAVSANENSVLDEIQQQVIELRGLNPKVKDLKQDTLTPAELEENVKNDFFKDYTPEEVPGRCTRIGCFWPPAAGFRLI